MSMILFSRTREYITLHDKNDFEGVIKLRISMWTHYTGLSERSQGPCIREAGTEKEIRQEK